MRRRVNKRSELKGREVKGKKGRTRRVREGIEERNGGGGRKTKEGKEGQ